MQVNYDLVMVSNLTIPSWEIPGRKERKDQEREDQPEYMRKEHTMVHSLRSGRKKIGYILNGRGVALQTFSCLHEFIAERDKIFRRRLEKDDQRKTHRPIL